MGTFSGNGSHMAEPGGTQPLRNGGLRAQSGVKAAVMDMRRLSSLLEAPVNGISAAAKNSMEKLLEALENLEAWTAKSTALSEAARSALEPLAAYLVDQPLPALWLAYVLAKGNAPLCGLLSHYLCLDPQSDSELARRTEEAQKALEEAGMALL